MGRSFRVCMCGLYSQWTQILLILSVSQLGSVIFTVNTVKMTYLENFREETRADLLTEEIVDSCQTGHGAPQSPVRWRPHAVWPMEPMQRRLPNLCTRLILIHNDGCKYRLWWSPVRHSPHGPVNMNNLWLLLNQRLGSLSDAQTRPYKADEHAFTKHRPTVCSQDFLIPDSFS